MVRQIFLGKKQVEVLHTTKMAMKDRETGSESTLYKTIVLIPDLSDDAFEVYFTEEVKRGASIKAEVTIAPKTDKFLKLRVKKVA